MPKKTANILAEESGSCKVIMKRRSQTEMTYGCPGG